MPASKHQDLKQYRAIAHTLNPIILVGDKGINEGMLAELDRALSDHELIKIKINTSDRDVRKAWLDEILIHCKAELVQSIGKVAVLLRRNPKPNPKLSNLLRQQG